MPPSKVTLLYDLLLIGHTWLREDKPHKMMHTNSSVLTGWRNTGALTGQELSQIRKNVALITHITSQSEFVYGRAERPRGELKEMVGKSDKHLLVLLPGRQGTLAHVQLVTSGGYFTVITGVGMAYARSVLGTYPALERAAFLEGWSGSFNSWL